MTRHIAFVALLISVWATPALAERCVPIMPVVGERTSVFGARHSGNPHSGTDIRAPRETPVLAAAGGVILHAGWYYAYGVMVEIEHPDGSRARYGHLAKLAAGIGRGDVVEAGSLIGSVGRTGRATGYHLHLELRRDGRPVDPWAWITRADCSQEATADRETP